VTDRQTGLYTDFNHFYCSNNKSVAHKIKITPDTLPLLCNHYTTSTLLPTLKRVPFFGSLGVCVCVSVQGITARTAVVAVLVRVPVVHAIVSTASASALLACLVRRVVCRVRLVSGAPTVSSRVFVTSSYPPAATLGSDMLRER